jgi:hypothetical protein
MMRVDGPETHTENNFPPPEVGTEWFLFLYWREDRQEFWIAYLDEGAFQVVGDSLIRPRELGRPMPATNPDALAEALRRVGVRASASDSVAPIGSRSVDRR